MSTPRSCNTSRPRLTRRRSRRSSACSRTRSKISSAKTPKFEKLGLDPAAFVGKPKAVVDILLKHKELMQRPIIIKGNKAIIGRPKDKAEKFLQAK